MEAPYILSIQVGRPKIVNIETGSLVSENSWLTGFFKEPVEGRIWLGKSNLSGDGQADLKHHGGADKAVLGYSADHYTAWHNEIVSVKLPYGAFGENFTVKGLTEESVCIGDMYAIGDSQLQVSQPRQPCWKISNRWRIQDLAERVKLSGRTGWYFRVIYEGFVERGLPLILLDRPFPQWTIACANKIMHSRYEDKDAAAELASCHLLSTNWRATLSGN
ncbi:MAG: MOSC domain-containing protein [Candidatus Jettenia sp.]|nr:MAG: MOSC domain-containing protein [Candidatus Jettenia sp.]